MFALAHPRTCVFNCYTNCNGFVDSSGHNDGRMLKAQVNQPDRFNRQLMFFFTILP